MEIIGIVQKENARGQKTTTLHLADEFPSYYSDSDTGYSCFGKQVQTVYLGTYDATELEVGMEVEIFYEKAVTTSRGTFQTVKKIEIL